MEQESNLLLYQSEDGKIRIETRLEGETVWLTQAQMAELFQKDRSVITKHIANIFEEGELDADSNVQILHIANSDKPVKYYNLDVIISVGYRVKSQQGGRGNYFEELLERIRHIRSSKKVFWRKVLDIYATSIDYDPKSELSQTFFKTVQNKMHWAAYGHTAAEVIYQRIDAEKPNLGLTHFKGAKPSRQEVQTAKNYLTEKELNLLNRMVTAYLEMAELQALNRKAMYMQDWISRLDDFLRMTGNDILEHAGSISHEEALQKAELEYAKYREKTRNELSVVEKDFIKFMDTTSKALKKGK